jgi:predicted enzyme related to lactoylglutathione lyase
MGKFGHMELNTSDPQAAKDFYSKLFGWTMKDMDMGTGGSYTMLFDGKEGFGGLMQNPMPGAPSHWLGYVNVASVTSSVAKARELGATVYVDHMEVPGHGKFGVFADPTGATVAVWESTSPPAAAAAPKKKAAKKKAAPKKAAKKKAAPKKKK